MGNFKVWQTENLLKRGTMLDCRGAVKETLQKLQPVQRQIEEGINTGNYDKCFRLEQMQMQLLDKLEKLIGEPIDLVDDIATATIE